MNVVSRWLSALAQAVVESDGLLIERSQLSVRVNALEEELRAARHALDVSRQTLMEIRHAQQQGPDWYRGETDLQKFVRCKILKAMEEITKVMPRDDRGPHGN